jgi:sugar lactone lactonase YvrE
MKHLDVTMLGAASAALMLTACGSTDETNDGDDEAPVIITTPDAGQADTGGTEGSGDAGEADTGGTEGSGDAGNQSDTGTQQPDTGPDRTGFAVLGYADNGEEPVEVETVVDSTDGLAGPRDVEFNPEAPEQMWVVNRADHSTVVVKSAGTEDHDSTKYDARGSRHFMAKPAALAFGKPGHMATAQQEDEKTQPTTPDTFMGVSLWPTDLSDFDAGHSSHLDMLHNSPLASGIAWDEGNAYWVYDGYHGSITHYDFQDDHGQGGQDHSDGIVKRYIDDTLGVEKGVVSHVAFDKEAQMLYAADTENNRIVWLDTSTGDLGRTIRPNYDGSSQRYVNGADYGTLVDGSEIDLQKPAGLEIHDGHLFVSDNATSTIHAFTMEGKQVDELDLSDQIPEGAAMGMDVDEQGRLYIVNADDETIHRVTPSEE